MSDMESHGESPERRLYSLEAYEIFGPERLLAIVGNEAGQESTQELLDIVTTLSTSYVLANGQRGRSLEYPAIWAGLNVYTNPPNTNKICRDEADGGLAVVRHYKQGKLPNRRLERKSPYPYFRESIFVDQNGFARIERTLVGPKGSKSATKPATELEVQEVLELIAEAVFIDDESKGIKAK